jgi:hypothetical protein
MGMDTQHNGVGRSDGLDVSVEVPLNGGDSGTARGTLHTSPEALLVLVFGVGLVLSQWDARERLLSAVTALAERAGHRLVAAA